MFYHQGSSVLKVKTILFILILLVAMIFNIMDLINDLAEHESLWHIIEESIVITLAFSLISYLIINLKKQKQDLNKLIHDLKSAKHSLKHSNTVLQRARKEYSEVIHQQFNEWHLSHGQQEIALLLLKGLSFIEIAAIRDTKEKTVRQQASEIYKKAGVAGRHAFSAWFFEDFL